MFQFQIIKRIWRAYILRRRAILHQEFCDRITKRSIKNLAANARKSAKAYKRDGYNPRRVVWSYPRYTLDYGWMKSYDKYWITKRHK